MRIVLSVPGYQFVVIIINCSLLEKSCFITDVNLLIGTSGTTYYNNV